MNGRKSHFLFECLLILICKSKKDKKKDCKKKSIRRRETRKRGPGKENDKRRLFTRG